VSPTTPSRSEPCTGHSSWAATSGTPRTRTARTNEQLLARLLATHREEVFIATKFGSTIDPATLRRSINCTAANARRSCEASLRRLGVEHIDLYYPHRVDPATPIEETIGAMAELVNEGKIRHLGLSEPGAETIRRAHATHPITKRVKYLEENLAAAQIHLGRDELAPVGSTVNEPAGERYDPAGMRAVGI
jgi:aryl-alcohol dehydrogenase-like predicted oxidoreductase